MITIGEIKWIAGLLEGEGCFNIAEKRYPTIRLEMTDLDIVQRARDILDPSLIVRLASKKRNDNCIRKDTYTISVCGHKAIGWMMTIYILMGNRRKEKIREVLKTWKEYEPMDYETRGKKIFLAKRNKQVEFIMNSRNISRVEAETVLLESWGKNNGGSIQ